MRARKQAWRFQQFGWAATQISHLSMIPVLTSCEEERNSLTSRRYAGTVLSNAAVFGLLGAMLGFGASSSEGSELGPEDVPIFRNVALACVGAGGLMSLMFHLSVKIKVRIFNIFTKLCQRATHEESNRIF